MTHLLLFYHPVFLNLDEPWVIKLLEAEKNILCNNGMTSLMCLMRSLHIEELEPECDNFTNMVN